MDLQLGGSLCSAVPLPQPPGVLQRHQSRQEAWPSGGTESTLRKGVSGEKALAGPKGTYV